MKQKRIWTVALVLAMLPAGARATPPIGGQSISFGTGNDVGASVDSVWSVAVGDLNNDGDLDIVSGSNSGKDYEVIAWENILPFVGTWTQRDVGASTSEVSSVTVGDLDNDGYLDIVSGSLWGNVIAWQNDGTPFDGTWTPCDVGDSTTSVWSVAVGDLDNDGYLDIVSGSLAAEDYEVIAWENDSTPFVGTWTQRDVGASTSGVNSVAVGDLDNDGDLDIVSGSLAAEDYEVIAWQNDGSPFNGTWPPNDVGASADHVCSVALGDLDNDGDLDIVSGGGSGQVVAWQNDGTPFDGALGWASNQVGSVSSATSVAVGDLDHDGRLDIVSGSSLTLGSEVVIWANDGTPFDGVWATQRGVGDSTASVFSVALGDLDHDSYLDLVSGSASGEDYEVIAWENNGVPFGASWPQNDAGASDDAVHSVALGDLDNDGHLDIVSESWWSEDYEVIVWRNDGSPFSGLWTQHDVGASATHVFSVAVGDLDNDGDLDVVSTDSGGDVTAWQNIGGSTGPVYLPIILKNASP